jgi:glycerol-1-phosphate dehydrogenase [NAD(P)+]
MTTHFDPGDIERFKADLRQIPGYPAGEEMPIREMVFEADALFRLPALLERAGARRDQALVVVMDQTAMKRGADDLKPHLLARLRDAGWNPEPAWLQPDGTGQTHTDMHQIGQVKARLKPGTAVLSVGSGTVTDIAKHAAYLYQQETAAAPLPFVVYQTANSVNAFTSNMASVFVDGVKRTLNSRYADVLVCDLETLRAAPQAMTAAGVGDLVTLYSSIPDWYLAHRLGLDSNYSTFAQVLMGSLDETLEANAAAIRSGGLEGTATLAKLITLGGLAMSLSHATTPFSGWEHVVSHLLDLLCELDARPLPLHGSQVALAALLTSEAYRIFLAEFEPAELDRARCYPAAETMHARIRAALDPLDPSGRSAAECWSDYQQKLEAWSAHRADFEDALRDWDAVRAQLQSLTRPPARLAALLKAVGGPLDFAQLDPPRTEAEVKFAFQNAPLIRRRLSLGDLFIFTNWDRESLWTRVNSEHARLSRL